VDLLPALPVALPLLVAAALVGLAPVCPRPVADAAAVLTAALVTLACLALLVISLDGPVVYWFGGWTPRGGIALGVAFAVDPVGAALATLAGVLATAALTFSWRIFEAVRTLHHGLMLVFLAGIVGFCLSGDLFNMFVFYELFSVAAYALAGYQTTNPGSVRGALNFAITNSVGAILVLGGIALLYGRTGALNLAQLGQSLARGPADRLVVAAFLLLMVGFFVKAAVVPFHFWLADAYALAPTVVGVLFAGVVSELGLYAVARVYWTVFSGPMAGVEGLRGVLLLGAVTTALVGGVMCLLQHHLARMLAYATVSHVGLTLAGFALLGPVGVGGAVLYLLADGLVKGALFISVGIVDHHLHDVDERRLRGRGRHMPWAAALMVAGALGLAGVPPFGTFLGKALMEEAALEAGTPWLIGLFVVVAALTSAALLRATGRVFLGLGGPSPGSPSPGGPVVGPGLERGLGRSPGTATTTGMRTLPRWLRRCCCWRRPWLSGWRRGSPGLSNVPRRGSPTGRGMRPPCWRGSPGRGYVSRIRRFRWRLRRSGRCCRRCSGSGWPWPRWRLSGCRDGCGMGWPGSGGRSRPRCVGCTTAASATR
jgi:multicomponent Na+:H+ antiporter subunit D